VATKLTLDQMKKFVREHFEEFVDQRSAADIRKNVTADFYDHDGPSGKPTGVDGASRKRRSRTLGHNHFAPQGTAVDNDPPNKSAQFPRLVGGGRVL
jgi:hypothetical protein